MKFTGIILLVFLKILCSENRMLPKNFITSLLPQEDKTENQNPQDSVMDLKTFEDTDSDDPTFEFEKKQFDRTKKPCAIVVLSNAQNPSMQSLLRKYRYDANGVLIPSSVKYFIKFPQGLSSSPILVPLNDQAFSPLGGFVRYYKEVPPIPQSW